MKRKQLIRHIKKYNGFLLREGKEAQYLSKRKIENRGSET
jgi:uncharacterized C2H2 Zn-finger protein